MHMRHDLELLEKLLCKRSEQIIQDALDCYVLHVLSHEQRDVYSRFLEMSNGVGAPQAGHSTAGVARFSVAPKAKDVRFSPHKTRGSIMLSLMSKGAFTRADFRSAVTSAMKWNSDSKKFAIPTRFPDLDQAERAWWGTLKGRDKLIREEPIQA
jgi:hypothetical protein